METSTNLKFILNRTNGGGSDTPGGGSDTPGGDSGNGNNGSNSGNSGNNGTNNGTSNGTNNGANNSNTNNGTNSGTTGNIYDADNADEMTLYAVDDTDVSVPNTGHQNRSSETSVFVPIFVSVFILAALAIAVSFIIRRKKSHRKFSSSNFEFQFSPMRVSVVSLAVLAIAFLGASIFQRIYTEKEGSAEATSSLSIASSSDVTIEMDESAVYITRDIVKVTSTSNYSYRVFMQADSDKAYLNGDKTSTAFFKPVTGSAVGNIYNQPGSWGYHLTQGYFDNNCAAKANGRIDCDQKNVLPAPTTATKIADISATASGTTNSSETEVYFEANPDGLGNGTYSAKIIYTVISDEPTTPTMSNFDATTLAEGESTELIDTRNNKTYTVKKLADGNVWMMDNLAISNVIMTDQDTNLAPGATFDLTSGITYSGSTDWCQENSTECANVKAVYIDDTNGGYYNWYTATAGNGIYNTESGAQINYDICPKGWHIPIGGSNTTTNQYVLLDIALGGTGDDRTNANTFSQIADIFSPASGRIYGSLEYVGEGGYYWASTAQAHEHDAYGMNYVVNNSFISSYGYWTNKFAGLSIRCIANSSSIDEPPIATMQNFDPSTLAGGTSTSLTDSRDNQEYTVYRWPDSGTAGTDYPTGLAGYAIMTKDLSLGFNGEGLTNVTGGLGLVLSADDSAGAGTILYRNSSTPSNWSTDNTNSNLQYTFGGGSEMANDYHSYYSFAAAQIACPKGWRLPTKNEYNNIVIFMGDNGSTNISNTPYSFVYGGNFYSDGWSDVGKHGIYWSSTQNGGSMGYALLFTSLSLGISNYANNYGQSARCIRSAS